MKPTIIIGGGIVGLFTAYYLQQQGVEVIIIDKSDLKSNTSTGNAGMIVPSHIIPLAAPGMISKGISWMFSSKSPFYIHPRLDRKLLEWSWLFYKAANAKHVEKSIPFLKNISLLSKSLYQDFKLAHVDADLELAEKGLMMLYQTPEVEKEEIEFAHLARKHGLEAEILSPSDIEKIEPNLEVNARGAVLFPGDAHLSPAALYSFLKKHLVAKGVAFKPNLQVRGFEKTGGKVTSVITDEGALEGSQFVLCGGAWTGELAGMLGFRLPMMGGKGYSFIQENRPEIKQAAILTETKVAVSPYGSQIRFGGTMEIAGLNENINLNRVRGIFESINSYYPDFKSKFPETEQIWKGLRPCSPDGLPYIGLAPGLENVLVGSGHGMMGISMAPATGKLLTQIHQKEATGILIDAFGVGRYE
ncbi:NAD(P)/FAD-dependent oxidoreductase [Belliella kenyensis]|uniref:NAD(P)/FAD-dependent oxidoreductase n=1 Tax=Belliella kenyensis TaxID=1472724 RepID=A0ABV8EL97_9BACT|nr:FAD-dependent oxidoreductase [Belliella kenyensis]MCH7401321.1 FAD-dependent oxidoreductase [Belliella kenyensis]MDN3602765.1 FAD-dependent oxidoreductase [Belliella kenyensis]